MSMPGSSPPLPRQWPSSPASIRSGCSWWPACWGSAAGCSSARESPGHRQYTGGQDHQLDREGGDVGVPFFREQRDRRLERLVAVLVIGRAAVDRHGEQGREEGGVDDRAHERDQIEPLERERAGPPDQREGEQAEADIAGNL